ncbi:MAG: hypothetical protein HRU41_19190 [Saprospiraceae bacterium]|nr:hypothetical protein [Saprospiraceae bacterium]
MQILTVVLGVVFILLLLSLLASTIMEFISSIFGLRGRNLLKALRNLLEGYKAGEGAVVDKEIYKAFVNNPLYRQLSFRYGSDSSKTSPPSYIGSKSFQSILFDILLGNEILEDQKLEEVILQKINELENEDLKKVLRQLWRDADGNIDTFKKKVEEWYNSVMERATGWYKRSTQYILVGVGFTIAVVLNADTLAIYERLENNPEVAERIANIAENLATQDTITNTIAIDAIQEVEGPVDTSANSIVIDTLAIEVTDTEEDRQAKQNYNTKAKELTTMVDQINTYRSPLGMGWKNVNFGAMQPLDIATKILGWLVTALAITLGAPFWFDILKKIVNLRGAGKKPDDE